MNKRFSLSIMTAGFGLSLLLSTPAFAHAALTGTIPAADTAATEVTAVSITANEDLLNLDGTGTGFVLAINDAEGHYYGDGCVAVDGATASMPVQLGAAGQYNVAYRVVSADGHPIEGSWSFTYSPAPDAPVGQALAEMPVCGQAAVPVATPTPEATPEPMVTTMFVDKAASDSFDIVPFIGLATIPVLAGAIWLLIRLLGKRDSEDHLN